jgi:hypothetical protein
MKQTTKKKKRERRETPITRIQAEEFTKYVQTSEPIDGTPLVKNTFSKINKYYGKNKQKIKK